MENDYTIDCVAWHIESGSTDPTSAREGLRALALFLQQHGLAKRQLVGFDETVSDDFEIRTGDLTDRGVAFIKVAYVAWLSALARGATLDQAEKFLVDGLRKV